MTNLTDSEPDVRFEPMARMICMITDFMPLGVVVVERTRRVLWLNRVAKAMVRDNDGLSITSGALLVDLEAGRLNALIGAAVDRPEREAANALTCMVRRPSGRRPYRALVVGLDAVVACIFLSDDEGGLYPDQSWLRSLFGLTHAEARLASLLAGGATLEQVTADMNIGMPTARTHLSRVLEKTGASRQAELVRLILRSPTLLLGPAGRGVGVDAA